MQTRTNAPNGDVRAVRPLEAYHASLRAKGGRRPPMFTHGGQGSLTGAFRRSLRSGGTILFGQQFGQQAHKVAMRKGGQGMARKSSEETRVWLSLLGIALVLLGCWLGLVVLP
jgi:hypothetical protein